MTTEEKVIKFVLDFAKGFFFGTGLIYWILRFTGVL
jgi:hypothetical protein